MPTTTKIEHLLELKKTLLHRLEIIKTGKKLQGYKVEKYKDYKRRLEMEGRAVSDTIKEVKPRSSSIDDEEPVVLAVVKEEM